MNPRQQPPLFTISNHHASGAHEPPRIDGDEPNTYHGYFENMHGDQSLFVYHSDTGKAHVYSGDAGWTAFAVVDGKAMGLNLSPDEQLWLLACLKAVGVVT